MRCSLLTLSSYLDDELDATRRAEVEAHLMGCERCHNGLEYLREEVSRIGSLARMHLPDEGARALLDQLGLIGPDDELPPRPPRPSTPPGDAPPWFSGTPAGGALPWTPRRDTESEQVFSDRPASDQPSLPFTGGAALARRSEPSRDAPAAVDTEVHVTGRPTQPRLATQNSPLGPSTSPPLSFPRPTGMGVLRVDREPPIAPVESTGPSPTGHLRDGPRLPPVARVEGDPTSLPPTAPHRPADDPWSWVEQERPAPDAPGGGPDLPGDPPQDPWSWAVQAQPDDPWSLVGREHPAPADLEGHPTSPPRRHPPRRGSSLRGGLSCPPVRCLLCHLRPWSRAGTRCPTRWSTRCSLTHRRPLHRP